MHPKLRPHQIGWTQHDGRSMLYLRDRMGLSDRVLLIPPQLAPILSLCDGTRDLGALRTAFLLQTGIDLSLDVVEQIVSQLEEALVLESPRAEAARLAVLENYRSAPFRPPALAGKAYPSDPDALRLTLDGFVTGNPKTKRSGAVNGAARGVISPHIDFHRGGAVYAGVWQEVKEAVNEAELAIIFGTDHAGGLGKLTFTRQSYCTPFGVLPTDGEVVDRVAEGLGIEDAFEEELNHQSEHSIELAAVWLHYVLGSSSCNVVPILCGSFHHFISGDADPASDRRIESVLSALRQASADRRTIVIAAADLAHVGPAFGDAEPFGQLEKAAVAAADKAILESIERGSASDFMRQLRDEGDRRRVCGLPPIYMALRFLGESQGYAVDYAQCAADADGGSLVSIAGVVLH